MLFRLMVCYWQGYVDVFGNLGQYLVIFIFWTRFVYVFGNLMIGYLGQYLVMFCFLDKIWLCIW